MTLTRKAVFVSLIVLGAIIAFTPAAGAAGVAGSDATNQWDAPAYDTLSVKATTPPVETETSFREALLEDFDEMDTNGDNQVSFAEAHAALPGLTQAVFDMVDTNGDGQISRAEAGLGGGCFGCNGGLGGLLKHLGDVFMAALALIVMTLFGHGWGRDQYTPPSVP